MTTRLRIRTGSTVVYTVLTVLRGLREVIRGVARIPNLVDEAIAVPKLGLNKVDVFRGSIPWGNIGTYGSAILLFSISKINALVALHPNQTVIALRLFRNGILCIKGFNLLYNQIVDWDRWQYMSISEVWCRLRCCRLLCPSICL